MSRHESRQSSIESESTFSRLFNRQSSKRKESDGSSRSVDRSPSPSDAYRSYSPIDRISRPTSPAESTSTPTKTKKFAGFASRSLRKSQWRLFKHRTFFGSTKRNNNNLQLPRLTLRHPSIDGCAMPLVLDNSPQHPPSDFLTIRTPQRRWTSDTSDNQGRLGDSRESSGFHDSHDLLDDVIPQAMTAPVSPSVPLSASSSQSDGWKYSSQKLLWKLKPKMAFSHASSTSSSTDSAWKSLDSNTWRSVEGAEVILRGARLELLSDIERGALQLVAAHRLMKILPGVSLMKPKDAIAWRQKRQKLIKSRPSLAPSEMNRRASGSSTEEDKKVFGVSIATCMQNERRLDAESRCRSLDDSAVCLNLTINQQGIKSVRSESDTSGDDNRRWLYPSSSNMCSSHPSSPSPIISSSVPSTSTNPILSSSANHLTQPERETVTGRFVKKNRPSSASFSCSLDISTDDVDPHALKVPRIVDNCTQYLISYGLHCVGLFRVAGNTKRCRQLRVALEKVGGGAAIGDDMVENTTTHDVATLLKEYFRDLPQSLLPKEHYQAYISAAKLALEDRIECCRLLASLLDPPNVDTLYVLLKFLYQVSTHSKDEINPDGTILHQGNKMDARNLATIFSPCILRPDHDKLQASLTENEQAITIVETMLTHVEDVFRIPKELQCQIYNKLREAEPDRLDRILNHLSRHEPVSEHSQSSPFPATVEEDNSRQSRSSTLERHSNGKMKVCSQRSGSWPFSLTRSPRSQRFFPSEGTTVNTPTSTQSQLSTSNTSTKELSTQQAPIRVVSPSREPRSTRFSASAARRRLRNVVRAFRFNSVTRSTPNVTQCDRPS